MKKAKMREIKEKKPINGTVKSVARIVVSILVPPIEAGILVADMVKEHKKKTMDKVIDEAAAEAENLDKTENEEATTEAVNAEVTEEES